MVFAAFRTKQWYFWFFLQNSGISGFLTKQWFISGFLTKQWFMLFVGRLALPGLKALASLTITRRCGQCPSIGDKHWRQALETMRPV